MSDGLSVIRRVTSGAPDDSPEAALLAQSLAALDALPAASPNDEVLARVHARAAEASRLAEFAALRGALGLGPIVDSAEAAVLAQSAAALDALPAYVPEPQRVRAVEREGERASLAAVLATADGTYPQTPEGDLLRQSAAALAALPREAPSDEALAAVMARAAEASMAPVLAAYGEGDAPPTVEAAVLDQSRQALDALPRYEPSGEAVAAVLSAAAVTPPVAAPVAPASAAPRRAADRAAQPNRQPRRRTGVWAGLATLAVAVIAAVVFLEPPAAVPEPEVASIADAQPLAAPTPAEPQAETGVEAEAPAPAPPVASVPEAQVFRRTAPSGPAAEDIAPVVQRRETASAPAPASASLIADAAPAPQATDWDAGEDVRLLSLRLRQLREQNAGLEWDEPAVAFGASGPSAGTTPGVRSVREGAPAGAARIRPIQPDTTTRR
ncbi:MAG TPA: hypothetical protein EYQ24_06635 [Bacteroidetes bacterium]|nr:hypothetical protein [Bacteroidota bacterium]HIL56528.1 hypothetical protein [Rhodothermales bacterium]